MKKKNKSLYYILAIIILVIIAYFLFFSKKIEYAELNDGPHIFGNPEASVVLVEYSDFQCPACGGAFSVVKNILEQYGDKIKFEYRQFPLTSIHQYAFRAAEASECAADQGKFWEYHDLLFYNQDDLKKKNLIDYASQVEGLDQELWLDCLDSRVKSLRVKEDMLEAEKAGYNATPTFLLNGEKVVDWSRIPEMIQLLIEPLTPLQNATSTESYLPNVKLSS